MSTNPNFSIPDFPPDIDKVTFAFPAGLEWPVLKDLPPEYRDGTARGCRIANKIFTSGWEGAMAIVGDLYPDGIDLAQPPEDHVWADNEERDPVIRFQRVISARLRSFEPKHEVKIATVGMMIDRWVTDAKGDEA